MKKNRIVLGFGVSGRSCAELLLMQGFSVIALDSKADELKNNAAVSKLVKRGVELFSDRVSLDWTSIGQIVISPGVPLSHSVVVEAYERGVEVVGEIELAFRHLDNRCIGVTGTNGKTTVVMLVHHILKTAGYRSQALGNIGTSLSSYAVSPHADDILVVELSSFQLDTLFCKCLDAALILNITPDHLDRYATMLDYAKSKCRIEQCLKKDGRFFVSKQTAEEYGHLLSGAKLFEDIQFERSACRNPIPSGVGQGKLYDNAVSGDSCTASSSGGRISSIQQGVLQESAVAPISPMRYIQLGVPERQNIQAAYALCRQFGITDVQFWRGLETFRKPRHRIEFVGEWNGISFYDDSKATNIDSVMHAVGLFAGPIVLLAGGVHKGWSYRPWIEVFRGKVARIVAFGQASSMIEEDLSGELLVERVETMEQAVCSAVKNAGPETTILLSPGCSSFDQFRNYEHRGNEFKRIIEEKVWIERKRS